MVCLLVLYSLFYPLFTHCSPLRSVGPPSATRARCSPRVDPMENYTSGMPARLERLCVLCILDGVFMCFMRCFEWFTSVHTIRLLTTLFYLIYYLLQTEFIIYSDDEGDDDDLNDEDLEEMDPVG